MSKSFNNLTAVKVSGSRVLEAAEQGDHQEEQPLVTEQKADGVTVYSFAVLSTAVVGYCVLWILLDISLSNTWPFSDGKHRGLDSASFGLINVLITFLLKAVMGFKLFEHRLTRKQQMRIVTVGCWVHLLCAILVRGPLYIRFRLFEDLPTSDKFKAWRQEDPYAFAASVFVSLSRHIADFILIPLYIRHCLVKNRSAKETPNAKSASHSDEQATASWWILVIWVMLWCLSVFSSLYSTNAAPMLMNIALWGPLVPAVITLFREKKKKSETKNSTWRPVTYFGFFIWLIELSPEMFGSLLALFDSFPAEWRSFNYLVFIVVTQVLTISSEAALMLTTRDSDTTCRLIYLIDFFQTFFSLLLLISVDIDQPDFWLITLQDMVNLIISETYGFPKLIKLFLRRIGALAKPDESDLEDTELRKKLIEKRIAIKQSIHDLVQQLLIETIATACLLVTYYAFLYFLEINSGIRVAQAYSGANYGVEGDEYGTPKLFFNFAVIYTTKMMARIVPFLYLRRRVRRFNQDINALEPRKVVQSRELLTRSENDLTQVGLPPLSIWNVMVRDLENEWWIFFVFASISATRLTLSMLSVLFNVNQEKMSKYGELLGAGDIKVDVTFWVENLYKRLLIG